MTEIAAYTTVPGHLQVKTTEDERVFAVQRKHGMRYTQYEAWLRLTTVKLKFVAMNLKKLATWKWKRKILSEEETQRSSSMDFLSVLLFFL
ncbi:MAG: hypothetical protein ACLSDM_02740 [Butyricicoccus sp.]